jgi:putative chitinase
MQLSDLRQKAVYLLSLALEDLPNHLTQEDGAVDTALRVIQGQPRRPGYEKPYASTKVEGLPFKRQRAVDLISNRLISLNHQPQAFDTVLDSLIRVLYGLSAAKTDLYEGLPQPCPRIKEEHIYTVSPYADPYLVDKYLSYINIGCAEFEINTRLRQSHFLAQLAYLSTEFNRVEEPISGALYEERDDLGNIYSGDGMRFKGRGLIPIVGRDLYQSCSNDLGINFIVSPKRLLEDEYAARSAAWYWKELDLNRLADDDDFDGITETLGSGGYDERLNKLGYIQKMFGLV